MYSFLIARVFPFWVVSEAGFCTWWLVVSSYEHSIGFRYALRFLFVLFIADLRDVRLPSLYEGELFMTEAEGAALSSLW